MKENEWIKLFSEIHCLTPYHGDAERFGEQLFSMDSFSETEDFFTHTAPEAIGHNMAYGAVSDILACGAMPDFLLQSWNLDSRKEKEYYAGIAQGIENVLHHYGAKCLGGDIGSAAPWCWTALVSGHSSAPVTRIAKERIPFDLYVSGTLGDVNYAVFAGLPMPELDLRNPVPADSLFATDTSGGFFDALENFRRVNPGLRMELDLRNVFAVPLPFDPVCSLIGGAGEYELVYAVPKGQKADGIFLGSGDFAEESRIAWTCGECHGIMKNPPPDYREVPPEKWLEATHNYLQEMCR